ncbi:MAG: hypothetical protein H6582_02680 [Crocinitomicaceae bacterium]|nr:hypothetical protein [Crocinitomicaceae bacterium]
MGYDNTHVVDKVVDALRKAATELEALQVQAALGKAEASDKYEELKKKFDHFVHETKIKFEQGKEKVGDIQEEVQALLDELRVQLALGKAEGKEAFAEQKKKIIEKIRQIENKIKSNPTLNKAYAVVLVEMEKFKVLLEWLEQKFEDGKEVAADQFEKGKAELNSFISTVKEKFAEADGGRWANFQDEMSQAFSHMAQAFKKP